MKSVSVCRSCGRTIDSEYLYCPWCGLERVPVEERVPLDGVFEQLEEKQGTDRSSRLRRLEQELALLEKDLDVLVMSAELHK